jgi:tetratricopeptide (TPR) repeat protein
MAGRKGKANRAPLIVFLGLGGAAAAGIGLWLWSDVTRAEKEAEAAARDVPVLPDGRLQFLTSNSEAGSYLALETVRREGAQVSATVLKVGRTTTSIKGDGKDGGAMMSLVSTVDCAAGRIFDGKVGAFDVDGKLVSASTGYSGKRGRVVEAADYHVETVCKGLTGRVVNGFRGAQRESQARPDDLPARAAAKPEDAGGWAWLCAAAARGHWRAEAPEDCRKALELRPDDHNLRTDRAYLFLKIGRRSESAADFARVLKAEPKNAAALYGRSLLAGIDGGNAGVAAGKADRCAALALDKEVAGWAARSYQLPTSQEFRVC